MNQSPKLKWKVKQLLGQNTVVNLYDFGLAIVFLAMRPKIQALKENIDKMGFIKVKKKKCLSKSTIKNWKDNSINIWTVGFE